ncbi:MAG: ECF transporter S component [Promethearchaeota archaeon]
MTENKEGRARWKVSKESIVPLILGILAYLGLEVLFYFLNLPTHVYFYITFAIFPAIAIPIVVGAKYGPIVGCLAGFGGKILADAILYRGIWIWWPIGIGLLGFIPGLWYHKYYPGKYSEGRNLFRLSLKALLAACIGTIVPTMSSIFTDQLGIFFPIVLYFIPMFFIIAINGVIIAPIIGWGLEHVERKYSSRETRDISPLSSSNLLQMGAFIAGFCFFVAFGLIILEGILWGNGHGGGCASVPFGHEIAGNLRITAELGVYIFIGLGIGISIFLLISWLNIRKNPDK